MRARILFHMRVVPLMAAVVMMTSGCALFRASNRGVDVSEDVRFGAEFNYTDLRNVTEALASELASSPFVKQANDEPVLMIAGVQNRTTQYMDTKNLTDRLRTLLFKTGEFRFINESRRQDLLEEQGYQAAHATPESQSAVGRQLGANFMLSGSMTEMQQSSPKQVRLAKKTVRYYKLTLEITDLETGELVWTTEQEFAREASKPLVGW